MVRYSVLSTYTTKILKYVARTVVFAVTKILMDLVNFMITWFDSFDVTTILTTQNAHESHPCVHQCKVEISKIFTFKASSWEYTLQLMINYLISYSCWAIQLFGTIIRHFHANFDQNFHFIAFLRKLYFFSLLLDQIRPVFFRQ